MSDIAVVPGRYITELFLGRVRSASRNTNEVPRASRMQSPPVRGIGSAPLPHSASSCRARAWRSAPNQWVASLCRKIGFFFRLFLLYQSPRGCSFEPVLTESGYVHRSEDVCYRIQCSLQVGRINILTRPMLPSTHYQRNILGNDAPMRGRIERMATAIATRGLQQVAMALEDVVRSPL